MQTTKFNAPSEKIIFNITSDAIGCILGVVLNIGLGIMFAVIG
jgi:hypothetical protein